MKTKKWHEREKSFIKKNIIFKEKECELQYEDYLIGNSATSLKDIGCGNVSVAHIQTGENKYWHLFLNGDNKEDEFWFEIVESNGNCNEQSFSECIYETINDENTLINIFDNYVE